MSHLFLLQPRQVWLTPVQGLCTVTHGLPAVYECQSWSMMYRSDDAKYAATQCLTCFCCNPGRSG